MTAYQSGENIYYKTIADIGPDTELLVWYGDDYARELGLLSTPVMRTVSQQQSESLKRYLLWI
jgi:hypothetical protein